MAKYRFFTVGFDLPGDDFEYISFDSDRTLLDADIILFEPTLGSCDTSGSYSGRPLLTERSSFRTKQQLDHWRSEIVTAVQAGKLVIVYLTKPIEYYRHTGEKQFSGTGRSRVTTQMVTDISSYEAIPNLRGVKPKSGKEIRLENDATYLAPYWKEFSNYSAYEVEIEGDFGRILLKSRTGDRILGSAIHGKYGVLLFLPPLRYDTETFIRYDGRRKKSFWTQEALKFGKRLATTLAALAGALKQSTQTTPPPAWTSDSRYRLNEESDIESAISKCAEEIAERQAKKGALEERLRDAGSLRRLLFEQGRPLESAILEALRLMGFEAKPFSDGESEFDCVFVSPEGRFLGEAEGKDNKAINIDKFSQLERNLQEDFARDEVTDYAKGVLFGNGFRLLPLAERGNFFTEKCISAAQRVHAALLRTPDLFAPAKYLKENPSDLEYAKQCREVIFKTQGEIVKFPVPPIGDETSLGEMPQSREVTKCSPKSTDQE
jgi:hypothetical protein